MTDNKSEPRFARFVVRPEMKGGMVGINVGLFEEGVVYEVSEVFDGEYMIRKLGPSPLSLPYAAALDVAGFSNAFDYNRLYDERGGNIVRTIAEHTAPKDRTAVTAKVEASPRGTKLRMDFGDENAWCEHIAGNVYRSLNNTLSNVTLKLPAEHEASSQNGGLCNVKLGHLFEGEVRSATSVRPLFIIGMMPLSEVAS
jgi:hypothetical protein